MTTKIMYRSIRSTWFAEMSRCLLFLAFAKKQNYVVLETRLLAVSPFWIFFCFSFETKFMYGTVALDLFDVYENYRTYNPSIYEIVQRDVSLFRRCRMTTGIFPWKLELNNGRNDEVGLRLRTFENY